MGRNRRAFGAEQHQGSEIAPIEDTQQFLIAPAPIVEDESLEEGIAFVPILGPMSEQPLQIVEIGAFDRGADLVRSLQMPGESEENAKIVLRP